MENRNQYNSPRDRIDDALLIRLLSEDEEWPEFTCTGERRNVGNSCGGTPRTGRRNVREHRDNDGCGCNRERRDNDGCGCNRERRDNDGCGCNRERRDNDGCGNNHERRENNGCSCNRERRENDSSHESCARNYLPGFALAMVYMPDHEWGDLYDEEEALNHGTLFRPLELPFYPGKCDKNCGCR